MSHSAPAQVVPAPPPPPPPPAPIPDPGDPLARKRRQRKAATTPAQAATILSDVAAADTQKLGG